MEMKNQTLWPQKVMIALAFGGLLLLIFGPS